MFVSKKEQKKIMVLKFIKAILMVTTYRTL